MSSFVRISDVVVGVALQPISLKQMVVVHVVVSVVSGVAVLAMQEAVHRSAVLGSSQSSGPAVGSGDCVGFPSAGTVLLGWPLLSVGVSLGGSDGLGLPPGGPSPGGLSPGGSSPDGSSPDGSSPGGLSPGGSSPGGLSPGGSSPGGSLLGGSLLGGSSLGGELGGVSVIGTGTTTPSALVELDVDITGAEVGDDPGGIRTGIPVVFPDCCPGGVTGGPSS